MKIRVKEYIGEKSKEIFQGISTISDAIDCILSKILKTHPEYLLYIDVVKEEINTLEELNRFVNRDIPPKYRIIFEEYDESKWLNDFIANSYEIELRDENGDVILTSESRPELELKIENNKINEHEVKLQNVEFDIEASNLDEGELLLRVKNGNEFALVYDDQDELESVLELLKKSENNKIDINLNWGGKKDEN